MEKRIVYRWTYNVIVIVLLIIGATVVILNFAHFGNVEWTDNAHVQQHITPVNARVREAVKTKRINEFHTVHKCDSQAKT